MGLFSFLFGGCSKQPASEPTSTQSQPSKTLTAPPEVTSESEEEGFQDLVLNVQQHKQLPDGSQSIRGSGTHKGRVLGLEVILGPTWEAGSVGKDLPLVTYRASVAIFFGVSFVP